MQSRRDQVQAQAYVRSRMINALVVADPDVADSPHRPLGTGTFGGLLVAALVTVGCTIYGFVRPGGATTWQTPGSLIVEKETGSRYVFTGDRLRPVLNYASARLLLGADASVVSVSQSSLGSVPHGQPVGIPGAPDALPAPGGAAGQVWTVCASVAVDRGGDTVTATTLAVTAATGSAAALGPGEGVLVTSGDRDYLLWNGKRSRLAEEWMAKVIGAGAPAVPVSAAFLRAVPAGPDVTVPDPGAPGEVPAVGGRPRETGDLFTVRAEGVADRYYQLRAGGLVALTPFAYALAAAASSSPGEALGLDALASVPVAPAAATGLPVAMPRIAAALPTGRAWCVRRGPAGVAIVADRPGTARDAVTDGLGVTRTDRTADAVSVAAGGGGLFAAGRPGQAVGSSRYLVTDAGVKYPVPSADAAQRLGYDTPAAAPPELLDLLPTGPQLGAGPG